MDLLSIYFYFFGFLVVFFFCMLCRTHSPLWFRLFVANFYHAVEIACIERRECKVEVGERVADLIFK